LIYVEGKHADHDDEEAPLCAECLAEADEVDECLGAYFRASRKVLHAIRAYEVQELLGEGGLGRVYSARRITDGAQVALKVLRSQVSGDPAARRNFLRELRLARQVSGHPNCVSYLDEGEIEGRVYFIMALCHQGSLQDMVRRQGHIPLAQVCRLVCEALAGLAHLHEEGLVHRDIKPQNLLVDAHGRALLADFGLAKARQTSNHSGDYTSTGAAWGTPGFMAREQVEDYKYVDQRADLWSMGATLYYLSTGSLPREMPELRRSARLETLKAILSSPIIPARERQPNLPEQLVSVIDRAVQDDPEMRYPDAQSFRLELLPLTRGDS